MFEHVELFADEAAKAHNITWPSSSLPPSSVRRRRTSLKNLSRDLHGSIRGVLLATPEVLRFAKCFPYNWITLQAELPVLLACCFNPKVLVKWWPRNGMFRGMADVGAIFDKGVSKMRGHGPPLWESWAQGPWRFCISFGLPCSCHFVRSPFTAWRKKHDHDPQPVAPLHSSCVAGFSTTINHTNLQWIQVMQSTPP